MRQNRLSFVDWFAVAALSLGLITLGVLSYLSKSEIPSEHLGQPHQLQQPELIEIVVEGAVKHPGTYLVNKGERLAAVLDQAEPLPEADLRKFKPSAALKKAKTVQIPYAQFITIYLEGAVLSPGALKLPKGTRLHQLAQLQIFQEEADLTLLDRKRALKDQETLTIRKCEPPSFVGR